LRVAFLSFRLGGTDGVGVESTKWQDAFGRLGWEVTTVAGKGRVDALLPGLGIEEGGPDERALETALRSADLVVVENLLSLPLNPRASASVAAVLAGRPALLRHHDLVWQHERWARDDWAVPTDPEWEHVVLSELSRSELAERKISSVVMRNRFAPPRPVDPQTARETLGFAPDRLVFLHPSRAIWRKGIDRAVEMAASQEALYWLSGPVEQGYGAELERLISASGVQLLHQPFDDLDLAYAAADAILFPSSWEGFGNPPLEASLRSRPVVVGDYPVARELRDAFGFEWWSPEQPEDLDRFLASPDLGRLAHNRRIAEENFSLDGLDADLASRLRRWGW
jgi:mannosylglucosylglycerate synthase